MSTADKIRQLITDDNYLKQLSVNDLLLMVKEYPLHQPLRVLLAKKASMEQHPSAANFMQEACLYTTYPDYLYGQVNQAKWALPHLPEAEAAAQAAIAEQLAYENSRESIEKAYVEQKSSAIIKEPVEDEIEEETEALEAIETVETDPIEAFTASTENPIAKGEEIDLETQPNFEFDTDFDYDSLVDENANLQQEEHDIDEILLVESEAENNADFNGDLSELDALEDEKNRPKIYTIAHVSDEVAKDLAMLRSQHEVEDSSTKMRNQLTEDDVVEVVQSDLDLLKQKSEKNIDDVAANKAISGYNSLMETVREKLDNIGGKPKQRRSSFDNVESTENSYVEFSNNSFHLNNPTETLASVLARQGNWIEAIDVYNQLMLKYPEKSDYFAGKIEWLKSKLR